MSSTAGPGVQRLPNLVIAGVTKAGTTSLFGYLGQHPDICPSDVKEVRYFNPLRYELGLEPVASYASHFRHCSAERYVLEGTPSYIYGGRAIASAIDELCSSGRVIISLREPVARCWSWFQFIKSRTGVPKSMTFSAYLDRCEELRPTGEDGTFGSQAFWGISGGCYADWLGDWIETFGNRLRILFFDDIVAAPKETVMSLCDWLEIDSGIVSKFDFGVENRTSQYRHRLLQQVAVKANRQAERFLRSHSSLKSTLRRTYYSVNKAQMQEKMTADERDRLARFYAPFNERLAEQLAACGIQLPAAWTAPPDTD